MAVSSVTRKLAQVGIVLTITFEKVEAFLAGVHATALVNEVKKIEAEITAKFDKAAELEEAAIAARRQAEAHRAEQEATVSAKLFEASVHSSSI